MFDTASRGIYTRKVLKVLPNYCKGGTEGQVLNLIANLDNQLFDISSACFSRSGNILSEFESLVSSITEYPINKLYHPLTLLKQLHFAADIRKQQYQIVHSYNFYANCFSIPAAKLAGVPVVIASIRDQGVYLSPAKKRVQKVICNLADRILVNADSIRSWLLEEGYSEPKITVIKNGIDLSLYDSNMANQSIREEFSIPQDAPLIVMLARLNPQKGFDDLIAAAEKLKQRHPTACYMIVGANKILIGDQYVDDQTYLNQLKSMTAKAGVDHAFIFTGHRQDTAAILAAADISVLPSHSEGLSNSILESMAAGTPVVATRVGGTPELIQHGANGLLIPVKSPDLLAQALDTLITDSALRQALGAKGRCTAEREYSIEKTARDTSVLYLSELDRACPSLARL
ncbi:glycosyltransferase involved in cell wall biosynthesis [Litorivivens lipolytica]|uniref:Glycosyltransferase involved in cell wall biosynthesis n=1 Tax=Litorivivens lipolytica TaxID=1524264 RepID=A0A7W4Z7A3_9GAMM|nr:glycosyltransferase family 4 protein [Litorivivens lipolytica]MBB3047825.1 glycosyltransferase involved in cell wall biosynthesis [Litorivivens lipolytica]